MNLYLRIAVMIGLLSSIVSPARAPAGENGCAPVGELHFICGPHHPEDLVLIPGTHWILVSGLGGGLPGSPPGPGDLYLLNAKDKRWHSIAQASLAAVNPNTKLYGDCPPPDASLFISHGLAIRAGSGGQHTLNAVTPLPHDGFIVTNTFDPKDPQAREKMGNGQYAGAVYQWQPGRGFTSLPGITGDNGVAISSDGKRLYFNWFFGSSVIRVARADPSNQTKVSVDFLPDNIHYAPDGSLYVTGQNVDPKQLLGGCPSGNCQHGTTIVRLDPATMKTRVIARLAPNATFSDGTTALQVGDTIFIGSYRGDAVAYMKAPQ